MWMDLLTVNEAWLTRTWASWWALHLSCIEHVNHMINCNMPDVWGIYSGIKWQISHKDVSHPCDCFVSSFKLNVWHMFYTHCCSLSDADNQLIAGIMQGAALGHSCTVLNPGNQVGGSLGPKSGSRAASCLMLMITWFSTWGRSSPRACSHPVPDARD